MTEYQKKITTTTKENDMEFQAIIEVEAALKAVERNGYALQYVKDQTEAVCLKAVESDGYALRYVLVKEWFIKIAGIFKIEITI